ncbi:MBL fold metallo-hydrolase [Luminiphilus sp. nBUS_07]|uniref:MBL fold metallo-hydrolase n=1 Tax=Luminiphilus sp. nBUS_07 TaxID=3395314 RepID=UPI003EBD13B0
MRTLALFVLLALVSSNSLARTQVVMLGTGTPIPTPNRSGPATAIVVNGTAYIVDFGPGVVRRAAAVSKEYGGPLNALNVDQLGIAFLTHLHHDHSSGLPDLVYTSWTHGREKPFELYGPPGTTAMASNVAAAWEEDNRYRLYGLEPATSSGWKINSHEIEEGIVYTDELITVEAFKVKHGTWPNAFGYRFTTPDKVIVISGDAAYDPKLEAMATGADILIHEVVSETALSQRSEFWQRYHRSNHTTAYELATLASRAKPKLLILYHVLVFGLEDEIVLQEVKSQYDGEVILAEDLDIFE